MFDKTSWKAFVSFIFVVGTVLGFADRANAGAITIKSESQFNLFASCLNDGAGDTLVGTVYDHITVVDTGGSSGAQISIIRFATHGDLVSQTTGEVFRINDNFSFRDIETPGGTTIFSISDRLTLVGPGGASLVDPFNIQVTQNANGEITATVVHTQRPICE